MNFDPHQPLRDDVRLLGEVLGRVLRHHEGEEIFQRVEQVREAAKRARTRDSELGHIDQLLREMPIASALTVARAFAHFLTLANIAEQHHRVHRRRDHARDPEGQPQRGSCRRDASRDCGRRAYPADALVGGDRARCASSWSSRRIPPRSFAARCCRNTTGLPQILAFRDRPDLTPDELEESLGRPSPRDCGRVADRRSAPRACHSARRSAGGARRVRAESLGRASAVPARRRSGACRSDRHAAAA